ncbi:S-methyl-5-thioribose-1-phosphate isomerase [Oscillatoria sp. FACHB-1406]|nr:S-methyl-5-thioribose-1-phosphate isomerase [Oscillatoria sp. FACHB-1406]
MASGGIDPIRYVENRVVLIDQTRIPETTTYLEIDRCEQMADAIKTMVVRGAPAIGVAAAYGMYLGAREINTETREDFFAQLEEIAAQLRQTRPTAVNLFWAIDRQLQVARTATVPLAEIPALLLESAKTIQTEDVETCRAIGDNGLIALPSQPEKLTILTHCNAGALATAGYGTALGVIRSAWREGRLNRVFADETRPRLQGAKLTAWECVQEGIPVTVITDGMAAHCMKQGLIDVAIVGADRIAANGDAANKIGTYGLAVVAKAHNVPFFVAAPFSTVDFKLTTGSEIPIEERDSAEIYQVGETRICTPGAEFYNPAFDVTPAELIAGIITERGLIKPEDLSRFSP